VQHEAEVRRRRLFALTIGVGVLSGLLAVGFRAALNAAEQLRAILSAGGPGGDRGWMMAASAVFSATTVGVGVWLVQRFAPDAAGSGIPHVEAVLHHRRGFSWLRLVCVKFIGGALGIGGGLALGREGPTVQMGAAMGRAVGVWGDCRPALEHRLIAMGAGAGLAAAFNAPLAGMVFVIEELRANLRTSDYFSTLLATTTADLLCRELLGQAPDFGTLPLMTPPLAIVPLSLAVGVLCGLAGVVFNRTLLRSIDAFGALRRRWGGWQIGVAVGALLGVIGWFRPDLLGGGRPLIDATLSGNLGCKAALTVLVLRFILTMGSYATGAAGGLFAPLLVLGAQLGFLSGSLANWFMPSSVDLTAFVIVGMGALFTGIVRVPVTGIILMIEMTGTYALILPLSLACLAAYLIADLLHDVPIYEALLRRDLAAHQRAATRG
jgi:CIC family chloride channel protein